LAAFALCIPVVEVTAKMAILAHKRFRRFSELTAVAVRFSRRNRIAFVND
jgi:hypothetical protein